MSNKDYHGHMREQEKEHEVEIYLTIKNNKNDRSIIRSNKE